MAEALARTECSFESLTNIEKSIKQSDVENVLILNNSFIMF